MRGIHSTAPTRATLSPRAMAAVALAVVTAAVVANHGFNLVMAARGFGHPWSTFLMAPSDRYADTFKMALSYPGAPLHPAVTDWGLGDLYARYTAEVRHAEGTIATHFHMPPVETLYAVLLRAGMSRVDPALLFLAIFGGGLMLLYAAVIRAAPRGAEAAAWGALALVCYPTLFLLDRGHVFALVGGVGLIWGTVDPLVRGRVSRWALVGMALALNMRPNAAIIPLAMWLVGRGWRTRDMVALGLVGAVMLVGALVAAHALYPAYDLARWRLGLDQYQKLYFANTIGVIYGSALYGALRVFSPPNMMVTALPMLVGGLVWGFAVIGGWRKSLRDAELIFLFATAYCLTGAVFNDYHLLIFIAPMLLLAHDGGVRDGRGWAIFAACLFVLAPKNYAFVPQEPIPWSWQVVANPLALLVASVVVLTLSRRAQGSDGKAIVSLRAEPAQRGRPAA